jgi:hypothetical protein
MSSRSKRDRAPQTSSKGFGEALSIEIDILVMRFCDKKAKNSPQEAVF